MSFAKRVKLTVAAFRILRGWRITTRTRSAFGNRYSEYAMVTFNHDVINRVANIHPWWKGVPEPEDYVLHEVLHIVNRALMMLVLVNARLHRRLEEWTVRDLCKVMGVRRNVPRTKRWTDRAS